MNVVSDSLHVASRTISCNEGLTSIPTVAQLCLLGSPWPLRLSGKHLERLLQDWCRVHQKVKASTKGKREAGVKHCQREKAEQPEKTVGEGKSWSVANSGNVPASFGSQPDLCQPQKTPCFSNFSFSILDVLQATWGIGFYWGISSATCPHHFNRIC